MSAIHLFDPEQTPERDPLARTVGDVIDWFLSDYTSTSAEALAEIRRVLALFKLDYGSRAVESLIGDDLRQFVRAQPRVKKANTISRWYRTVKHCFNQAEN